MVKTRWRRRGSTMIMVLLLMVTFVGLAAISLDMGRMYLMRTQLHSGTDAGALAGVQRLMQKDYTTAADTAVVYTQAHLVEKTIPTTGVGQVVPGAWNFNAATFSPAAGGSWTDPNNNAVQVTATYTGGYTFGRYFGYTTRVRSATSIAAIGSVGATNCIKPWAIPYEMMLLSLYPTTAPGYPYNPNYNLTPADVQALGNFTSTNNIYLKVGDPSQSPLPGSFYVVKEPPLLYANGTIGTPGSASAQVYRNMISAACSSPLMQFTIGPGDWLEAENGNRTGPTNQGTAALCGVPPTQNFTCSPPVPIKMVMWANWNTTATASGVNANCAPRCFLVKYAGVFVVTGYQTVSGSSGSEGVTGYFQTLITTGGFTPAPGPLQKIALVQ